MESYISWCWLMWVSLCIIVNHKNDGRTALPFLFCSHWEKKSKDKWYFLNQYVATTDLIYQTNQFGTDISMKLLVFSQIMNGNSDVPQFRLYRSFRGRDTTLPLPEVTCDWLPHMGAILWLTLNQRGEYSVPRKTGTTVSIPLNNKSKR